MLHNYIQLIIIILMSIIVFIILVLKLYCFFIIILLFFVTKYTYMCICNINQLFNRGSKYFTFV